MPLPQAPRPDFRSPQFLCDHIADTMAFYHPRCIDGAGGFFHFFADDGTVTDRDTRHLVSSTRFIFNYAMAARLTDNDAAPIEAYRSAAEHGLHYLRERHRNPDTGAYAWLIDANGVSDDTNHCYGLAFVMLSLASTAAMGHQLSFEWLDEAFQTTEQRFRVDGGPLYADEASGDWSALSTYRGQNANMHSCEALIAAYEATSDVRYLDRACEIAQAMTRDLARHNDGLVWEHYHQDWTPDWDYNRDDPAHLFRPWGYQPGHQTEWAKLLMILERHRPEQWMLPTARHLFDTAVARAWDTEHGGLCYGFGLDGKVCDADKYFWVQAESLAAAWLLEHRCRHDHGNAGYAAGYGEWYQRLWAYSWEHFIDHEHGAWYRILDANNQRKEAIKSPAGKTDYHTMGACWEILRATSRHGEAG